SPGANRQTKIDTFRYNSLNMTQEQLLASIAKGDPNAFTLLYDHYSKSLFSVIRSRIRDTAEAEDVLQEVFVKIWKNIDSYSEEKGRFYTWILNIARNASIDRLRSKSHANAKKNLPADNFVNLPDDGNGLNRRI